MERDLQTAPIGDHLIAIIDYRGKTPPKSEYGIPTLTAANVRNGRVDLSNLSYVTPETYRSWTTRGFPEPSDVLITTEAPVGEVASFPGDRTYLITRRLMALRGHPEELDNRFLKYSLLAPTNRQRLLSATRGSTVPRVLKTDITGLRIWIPRIDEQRAIAGVLGALDDKIEQNRRTSAKLEELARAVFRAWFVDFDPVHAKAAGAAYFPGMPQEVFNGLPTEFVESEIGLIPKGWGVQEVEDLCGLSKQQLKPLEHAQEYFDHFSIPAYDASRQPITELGAGIKSNKFSLPTGCVLISKLNPRIPRVWLPPSRAGRRQIASTEFLVLVPKASVTRERVYCQFTQARFLDELSQKATGTSNSHQRVKPRDFLVSPIVAPDNVMCDAFDRFVIPLMYLIEHQREESTRLAEVRDYLLPKLLSGEVRARHLEGGAT